MTENQIKLEEIIKHLADIEQAKRDADVAYRLGIHEVIEDSKYVLPVKVGDIVEVNGFSYNKKQMRCERLRVSFTKDRFMGAGKYGDVATFIYSGPIQKKGGGDAQIRGEHSIHFTLNEYEKMCNDLGHAL